MMFLAFLQFLASVEESHPEANLEPLPYEWVYLRSRGESPDREMGVIDKSSIDRADFGNVKFRTAIIYEMPRQRVSYISVSHTVNCVEQSGLIVFAQLHGEDGQVLRRIEEEPYGDTMTDTPAGRRMLGIVCDDEWPEAGISFASLEIPEIFPFLGELESAIDAST